MHQKTVTDTCIGCTLQAPPALDAVVNLATVELFGAMPRFGSYLSHGSRGPGVGYGPSGANPNPLLQARTDQAHGAECSWEDDEPNSKDSIPGRWCLL